MPYTSTVTVSNFRDIRLFSLQSTPWYSPEDLANLLISLYSVSFSAVSSRATGLNYIQSLASFTPFIALTDHDVRFPSPGTFVPATNPPLNIILQSITSALNYKEPPSNAPPSEFFLSSFNAYYNSLTALSDFLYDSSQFFNQYSFESFFHLSWSTS
jgi:hypothetical protein